MNAARIKEGAKTPSLFLPHLALSCLAPCGDALHTARGTRRPGVPTSLPRLLCPCPLAPPFLVGSWSLHPAVGEEKSCQPPAGRQKCYIGGTRRRPTLIARTPLCPSGHAVVARTWPPLSVRRDCVRRCKHLALSPFRATCAGEGSRLWPARVGGARRGVRFPGARHRCAFQAHACTADRSPRSLPPSL